MAKALLLHAASAAALRTVVPFQYAWRFHCGDDPSVARDGWPAGPGTCSFEDDLQDFDVCEGTGFAPTRFSAKDCRTACCYDPECMVWQSVPGSTLADPPCYRGYRSANVSCPSKPNGSGMSGGRRSQKPSPAFRTDYSFAGDEGAVDDSDCEIVDAPHDFIAERGNFTNDSSNFKQGYLPRNVSWYRTHFTLPAEWKDGFSFVHFEGVFHRAEIYLNGEFVLAHDGGYTDFTVRLDNASSVRYGDGKSNVLAVRADASYGSGHWYEGGGLYRPVSLVHSGHLHFAHNGVFVTPSVESPESLVRVVCEVDGLVQGASLEVRLLDAEGEELARNHSSAEAKTALELHPGTLKLWSIESPALYRVEARLLDGDSVSDDEAVTVGFRSVQWGVSPAFALNGEAMKLRGFSHHNSIGGLGVAIPERVYLFRVQASRAMGSNIWRNSHNPYPRSLYSLLDATGTMCWDETRDYGAKYGSGVYVDAMRDMVRRDRNHPSIVVWSVCNERECNQTDPEYSAQAFTAATREEDPTRAVSANMIPNYGDLWQGRRHLDVIGFSHKYEDTFEDFHREFPDKPSVSSECTSCSVTRMERNGSAECQSEPNSPGLLPYVAGSLGVWTLMDHFGEPHGAGTTGWPHVSSRSGMFDMAGFPKADAWWYPINWLKIDAGRPTVAEEHVARILDFPDQLERPVMSAVTSAPQAELVIDGKSLGVQAAPADRFGQLGPLYWNLSSTSFQSATVHGLDAQGKVLASHSLQAPQGGKRHLGVQLDVPSEATGTGTSLVLDGRDTAMLRVSVLEMVSKSRSMPGLFLASDEPDTALVSTASDRVTWRVVSGPGRVIGVTNGDPQSHEWVKNSAVNAFAGLARAFVQVTRDCVSANAALAVRIDRDTGKSKVRVAEGCDETSIVVEASAEGFEPVRVVIPVSTDLADVPVAVAAKTVGQFRFSYMHDFLG